MSCAGAANSELVEHSHPMKALPRSAQCEQASLPLANQASAIPGAGKESRGKLGRGIAFQHASSSSLVESQRPGGAFSRRHLFTHASLPI